MAEGLKKKRKVKVLVMVSNSVTPWTIAHQDPLSMEFSRQEYWIWLPFPSPGDLPDPEIKPTASPAGDLRHCRQILYHPSHQSGSKLQPSNHPGRKELTTQDIGWEGERNSYCVSPLGFYSLFTISLVQLLSRVRLCDPMNHSTPGLPVHHQLPEFTQTHDHQVGDAIHHHPLSSPFPPAPNPSQHQSLFQWVNSSHEVAEELEFQL